MGAQQATGKTLLMPNDVCDEMNKFPQGLDRRSRTTKEYSKFSMSQYRIAEAREQSPAWLQIQQHMKDGFPDAKQSRAIACMVGLACGDAVGAPLEFLPLNVAGYGCAGVGYVGRGNKFQLLAGQWTDDTSMSLCLADSLIQHPDFAPRDLRLRFMNWWQFGYNNAFGAGEFVRGSVGLGGNISESFNEFLKEKTDYTTAGDNKTSGNGSLMRLAPCAVRFWGNVDRAMEVAALQSKTTHQGDEAAECCRLLAFVICKLIAFDGDAAAAKQEVLGKLGERFVSGEYSVQRLAAAEDEESHPSNGNGVELEERKWSWKRNDFEYSVKRSTEQPGYIGSYCMDGLSMALHCVWVTADFRSAVIKAVDMGGDADTVGAITAQIAGALYGAESIPADWIAAVQQWDGAGSIAYRASLLFEMGKPA